MFRVLALRQSDGPFIQRWIRVWSSTVNLKQRRFVVKIKRKSGQSQVADLTKVIFSFGTLQFTSNQR